MKRIFISLLVFIIVYCPLRVWGDGYAGIDLTNSTNFAQYFNQYLGYLYDSHGCLHFAPSDIYLLVKTIPKGTPLRIKRYDERENEIPFAVGGIPFLAEITNSPLDLEKHARDFKEKSTRLVVYPALDRLYIVVDGNPYAQMKVLAGPSQKTLMAFEVQKGKPVVWDFMLATPTDPGDYSIYGSTSHYLSHAYYKNTVVPFGSWMVRTDGKWAYQRGDKWHSLPSYIIEDLLLSEASRRYNYYDLNLDKEGKIKAARWAGHDFGKYVLFWTNNGEMGYAAGELLFEQIMLAKDLVHLLTMAGPDDFESCVAQNKNFTFYKQVYEFIKSKGKKSFDQLDPEVCSYYRLYHAFELSEADYKNIDERVLKAFNEYRFNRLPRKKDSRCKALGLYYYLKITSAVVDKYAYWYEKTAKDWEFWRTLRLKLREDFDKMGILSEANRQNIVEEWLSDRLEFKLVSPPGQAKNLQPLSFSSYFSARDAGSVFTVREQTEMHNLLERALSGEAHLLQFCSVDALNNYNFGLLLNEILGDLYKSHGCMHISPRNMYFLYKLLSVGTQIKIYDYSTNISENQLKDIPYLAHMVNYDEDILKVREQFAVADEVKVAVYPSSGYWIIYLKDKPFAKLQVKGGPQSKMYLVQGRDKKGFPIFEDHLAYPTSTGDFFVFKKVENYISNIYRDTTVIPMGGAIKKEKNKWVCQNKKGEWLSVPKVIEDDLKNSPEKRAYAYYDAVKNTSGEVVEVKWGSHPFGWLAILNTKDGRSPFPELIHSSGDLMMEERQLIDDIIKVLSAPHDELEKCVKYSANFDLYKACCDFVADPLREDLIQPVERASYRLYKGLSLNAKEAALLPGDVIIADKVLKNKGELTREEARVLLDEGIAAWRGGKLKINLEKILGLQFDTYQCVVMIEKYAHHYETLKKYWEELGGLRSALLKDFKNFVIKDALLFHRFTRELMLKRTRLQKLSQQDALKILKEMLAEKSP